MVPQRMEQPGKGFVGVHGGGLSASFMLETLAAPLC
jgi:hypothetical protein